VQIPGVGVHLHDTAPVDPFVGAWYVLALALTVAAARRSATDGVSRRIWFGVYLVLAVLLINQQSDIYNLILGAVHDRLAEAGVPLLSPLVLATFGLLLAACGVTVLGGLWWLRRRGHPPGDAASAGLVLLAVFILGRGARLVHVIQGGWGEGSLALALKLVELLGLILVTWGAWSWRAPRTLTDPRTA
jgi:hypothetical protein